MNNSKFKTTTIVKKIFILALSIIVATVLMPHVTSHSVTSEKCGNDLTWTHDETSQTLTISGTGEMTSHPWDPSKIKSIEMKNGLTSICDKAFANCTLISSITIPNSVTKIGKNAFEGTKDLRLISLPDKFYPIEKATLGISKNVNISYTNDNNITSTQIDKNDIVWLNENSGGLSTWYGLDNTNGTFDIGSKFWIRWLSNTDSNYSSGWDKYIKTYPPYKIIKDGDDYWMFLMEVDGSAKIFEPTTLYIQLGTDWSVEEVKTIFTSDDVNASVDVIDLLLPDNTKSKVAKVTITHFPSYNNKSESSDSSKEDGNKSTTNADSVNNSIVKTADTITNQTLLTTAALLILSIAGIWLSLRKRSHIKQ